MKSRAKKPIKSDDSFQQSQNDLEYTHSEPNQSTAAVAATRRQGATPRGQLNVLMLGPWSWPRYGALFNSCARFPLGLIAGSAKLMALPRLLLSRLLLLLLLMVMILVLLGMLDFSTYTNFGGRGEAAQNEKWQHTHRASAGSSDAHDRTQSACQRGGGEWWTGRGRRGWHGMTLTVCVILFASFWCCEGCETFECEIKW